MKKFCPICLEDRTTPHPHCAECGTRLIQVDPDDLSGLTLDEKYEILEKLAQGGMGVVYRARQVYLEREVALKVLRSDLPRDSVATKRFMLEVRSVSSLHSSHTVTIHDFGISRDGRLYFAMELLKGESLEARLARGPLPWAEATTVVLQTCESLAEAHAKAIWHRDIKPANIFLTRSATGGLHAKILDFGIAKVGRSPSGLTVPGRGFGTPAYSSPEQVMGEEMDHRSDLYSLGVVFYEMLAGLRPFGGEGSDVLMQQIRNRPQSVKEAAPTLEIPESIAEVVDWTLQKLPTRRPDGAVALARRLREAAVTEAPGEAFPLVGDVAVDATEVTAPKPASGSSDAETLPPPPREPDPETEPDRVPGAWATLPPRSATRILVLFLISFLTATLALFVWRPWEQAALAPETDANDSPPAAATSVDVRRDMTSARMVDAAPALPDIIAQPEVKSSVEWVAAPDVPDPDQSEADSQIPDSSVADVQSDAPALDGGELTDALPATNAVDTVDTRSTDWAEPRQIDSVTKEEERPEPPKEDAPRDRPRDVREPPADVTPKKPVTKPTEYGIIKDDAGSEETKEETDPSGAQQGEDDEYGLIPTTDAK